MPELATASPACHPRPARLDASMSHPEAPGHAIPPVSLPSPFPTMDDGPVAAPSSWPRPPSSSLRAIVSMSSAVVDYIE